jgi:16S rRNA (cytosine967-C5)-methyltransferase
LSAISPARVCAYAVVRRVFESGAYADRALNAEARGLSARDRALAMRLAYGTVQRRGTLDHVVERLSGRPIVKLDPPVIAALRLGLLQLLFLDGIGEHAAVNESVELCKRSARGGAGLVNAVLRRAAREGRGIVDGLDDTTPARAAIKHSVPEWLASMWFAELGAEEARALLESVNEPAESALRVNTLKGASVELPVRSHPAPGIPEGLVLEAPFDAFGSAAFREGRLMPQSRGSMQVARVLAPEPGDRVLDLCAAPGAKTTHLAALMGGEGPVVAVESNPRRAQALRETCELMGADSVHVRVADSRAQQDGGPFDRVLVDPPCSGLGTLQSRPDIRWRASAESIRELSALQAEILASGAAVLAPGGVLVYSVCTISRAEGDDLIDAFVRSHPEFAVEDRRQLMPHTDGTDGFFIARLHRRSGAGTR